MQIFTMDLASGCYICNGSTLGLELLANELVYVQVCGCVINNGQMGCIYRVPQAYVIFNMQCENNPFTQPPTHTEKKTQPK